MVLAGHRRNLSSLRSVMSPPPRTLKADPGTSCGAVSSSGDLDGSPRILLWWRSARCLSFSFLYVVFGRRGRPAEAAACCRGRPAEAAEAAESAEAAGCCQGGGSATCSHGRSFLTTAAPRRPLPTIATDDIVPTASAINPLARPAELAEAACSYFPKTLDAHRTLLCACIWQQAPEQTLRLFRRPERLSTAL